MTIDAENTNEHTFTIPRCSKCLQPTPTAGLKLCGGCKKATYCSKDCQQEHWAIHKYLCTKVSGENALHLGGIPLALILDYIGEVVFHSSIQGLAQPIWRPFNQLIERTYLHNRPERDVFMILVDAYRLRMEDHRKAGHAEIDSIYAGSPNGLHGLARFLFRARHNGSILPPWFDESKEKECLQLTLTPPAATITPYLSTTHRVDQHDIIACYRDARFPMQLRFLAEIIYGYGVGGKDNMDALKHMAELEESWTGWNNTGAPCLLNLIQAAEGMRQ